MFEYQLSFDRPWYLVLLGVVPVLWWLSYRSLAGLGRIRRWFALSLRSILLVLLIFALAEAQLVKTSDRLTVIYLADQSLSISPQLSDFALDYYNRATAEHRGKANTLDRAGMIAFGREPAIEVPPFDETQLVERVESMVDREYTDLASAMRLAQALFPHDTAKRVVVVSDGNQNLGDALEQARSLAEDGIGIDVVPIVNPARGDVAIEKVTIPTDVRKGQPFDLRVVTNNTAPDNGTGAPTSGRLQIYRKTREREQLLADDPVTLPPGKRVFTIPEEIDQPDFYTYEARFVPDEAQGDAVPQNNAATTFTHVRGSGQVLVIQDYENKGEFDTLVERLRDLNIEVTLIDSRPEELFTDLSQLQPFDTVILANVPREHFSDEQIEMLVRNTQNMGCGLVMMGGPNSFGAGGWTNTRLEEAMPVDFQIKSAKVVPVGALALLMHASELAQGNYWQKVIAREAIKTLGHQDYCGLLHWSDMTGTDDWLWKPGLVQVGAQRQKMLAMLDRMTPGDMPQFDPAMNKAAQAFERRKDAAVKHMIIISDGDPSPPSAGVINRLRRGNVKVTTVAVGTHGPAGSTPLRNIAVKTGGKYYVVRNAAMLPRIYQEVRRLARPLVYERKEGIRPSVVLPHEMVRGIEDVLPPIFGFVLTSVKENPLVEVSLLSPQPAGKANASILASWTYGLGKAVALTTDAGRRWATEWTSWEGYKKLYSQVVRWSMRPVGDTGKFTVAADVEDGEVRVVVTALDKDDEFLNFLNIGATVVGPDLKPVDTTVAQTHAGRYVGRFPAKNKGTYSITLSPGAGMAPIRAAVNVPYSDEFRDQETNMGLLESLASTIPKEGTAGKLIVDQTGAEDPEKQLASIVQTDIFRHDLPKATSSQDVWHLLVLAGSCLFFFDVFTRRVAVSFAWVSPLAALLRDRVLRREPAPSESATMDRLRSRKAEVSQSLEQKRAAARFEPTPDAPASSILDEPSAAQETSTQRTAQKGGEKLSPESQEEADSYTNRLLKAKRKVWEDRKTDRES